MSCSSSVVIRSVRSLYSITIVPYGLHVGRLGARRLAVDVDVLDFDASALVGVLVEPLAEAVEVGAEPLL